MLGQATNAPGRRSAVALGLESSAAISPVSFMATGGGRSSAESWWPMPPGEDYEEPAGTDGEEIDSDSQRTLFMDGHTDAAPTDKSARLVGALLRRLPVLRSPHRLCPRRPRRTRPKTSWKLVRRQTQETQKCRYQRPAGQRATAQHARRTRRRGKAAAGIRARNSRKRSSGTAATWVARNAVTAKA